MLRRLRSHGIKPPHVAMGMPLNRETLVVLTTPSKGVSYAMHDICLTAEMGVGRPPYVVPTLHGGMCSGPAVVTLWW